MVFKKEGLGVEHGWILSEKECLDLDELDICILLRVIARETRGITLLAAGYGRILVSIQSFNRFHVRRLRTRCLIFRPTRCRV